MSPFAQNKIMDHILSSAFISLHFKEPGDTGKNEISSVNYKRINASNLFLPSKKGVKNLGSDILFTKLPTTTITHIGIWDQEKNGNFLVGIELDPKRDDLEGDSFTIPANELSLSIS